MLCTSRRPKSLLWCKNAVFRPRQSLVPPLNQVAYVPDGMEAIIFTADGDMRQALNNLQVRFRQQSLESITA